MTCPPHDWRIADAPLPPVCAVCGATLHPASLKEFARAMPRPAPPPEPPQVGVAR
jgi:hypothetical protein